MLVQESPKKVAETSLEYSNFEALVEGFVHEWVPHTTLTIFGASCAVFIIAIIITAIRLPKESKLTSSDYFRIGFAAGPIPIYFMMPLAPFDEDLAIALMQQPFQLFLAAAAGVLWTVTDINLIAKNGRANIAKPEGAKRG